MQALRVKTYRYVWLCRSRYSQAVSGSRNLTSSPSPGPFNILFLGRDEFSVLVLDQLYCNRDVWDHIWVATLPDEKTGRRGSKLSISPLKTKSLSLGLDTLLIPPKHHFKDWMPPAAFHDVSASANSLLVTASFGRMISDRLLHLFAVSRRLNVHPSLIPMYRGPAPIQHTLADGQDETGVTILEMKEKRYGADGGEVWSRKTMSIPPGTNFTMLRDRLGIEGGNLLVSVLRDMMSGIAVARPQDETKVTYAPFITQETAQIDFSTWDADKVERMYRAISHQKPLTATLPSSKTLQLHKPQPFNRSSTRDELPKPLRALKTPGDATYDPTTRTLAIRCANDTYILVPSVKQQDKSLLAAKEWWNGVRPEWIREGVLRLG